MPRWWPGFAGYGADARGGSGVGVELEIHQPAFGCGGLTPPGDRIYNEVERGTPHMMWWRGKPYDTLLHCIAGNRTEYDGCKYSENTAGAPVFERSFRESRRQAQGCAPPHYACS